MAYVNNPGGPGIIFFPTSPRPTNWMEEENPDGQFYLWSPLMIFSLVMACVVGLIILILLLYFLFYYCVYGTCCCPGMSCWWCPQAAPAQEEPVKVHVRRPSRSDSCRSSVRSRSSSVCSHRDYDDRKLVRINSCPSINESVMGVQPMIIQTIPAIQAPQVYQQPIIQAAPAPLPPPAPPASSGFNGELRVVIGESRPAASARSDNVIVYDMARSNGSGITLGGGGAGRREYEMTSVDDFGGTYRGGAFNGGFDRDDGGSFLSEGHRSAVIDIGKGGGNFYPSLPHYDD